MLNHIRKLHKHCHKLSASKVHQLLNKWNNDQGQAIDTIERHLKTPLLQYQWSDKVREAGLKQQYWRLQLQEIQHHVDYTHVFDYIETSTQRNNPGFKLLHQR